MPTPDPAAVRKWARAQGLVSADRGRLPRAVTDAYAAAHPDLPSSGRRARGRRPAAGTPDPSAASAPRPAAGPPALPDRPEAAPVAPRQQDSKDDRLDAVEARLAQALARLDALERQLPRSLFGFRWSL